MSVIERETELGKDQAERSDTPHRKRTIAQFIADVFRPDPYVGTYTVDKSEPPASEAVIGNPLTAEDGIRTLDEAWPKTLRLWNSVSGSSTKRQALIDAVDKAAREYGFDLPAPNEAQKGESGANGHVTAERRPESA